MEDDEDTSDGGLLSREELLSISFSGIKITTTSIDQPSVVLISSIDYTEGIGYGQMTVLIDG